MDYSKFILLGLMAIAGFGNGFVITQNRTDGKSEIRGGKPIPITKAPYQVYLKKAGTYFCGGALIEPDIVLTAAHCVDELEEPLYVVAGTDSTKLIKKKAAPGSITIRAEEYRTHFEYDIDLGDAALKYDIAVIKLAESFPKTKKISPIQFATDDVREDDELLLTGIGTYDEDSNALSPYLKAYKAKVIDCEEALPVNIYGYTGVICYGSPVRDSTGQGDSGSPLVNSEGRLIGIHSGVYEEVGCETGVNVIYYSKWIKQVINQFSNLI